MAEVVGINDEDVESDDPSEDPGAGDGDQEGPEGDDDATEPDVDGESGPSPEGELDGETDDDPGPDADPVAGEKPPEEPKAEELPEGFASKDELIAAAKASRQTQAELAALRAVFYGQQRPQPVPEKPKPWIPGADDPEVVRVWEAVRDAPDALKALPPHVQQKVTDFDRSINARWSTYQRDPAALVRDHVIPMLEGSRLVQEVRALRDQIDTIKGREILQQHATVVATPEDRRALEQLLRQNVPSNLALQFLAQQKELAALKAKPAAKPGSQAQRDKDRASQANKRAGQRPGRPGQAPKTMNVQELADWAKKVHGTNGIT